MSLEAELYKIRAEVLKPAPVLSLVEWADQYRFLSKESSSEAGRWKTSRVEVARGPMMAVTDPSVEKITIMAPTQLMKTELINNIVGYYIDQDPSPMIVVQPTKEVAEAWSKDRLDPMLRDSPQLADKVSDKKRESGTTILHKQFPGGHVTMVGANAPSGLAMRPVRIVLCDETDKYPDSAGKEGDPIKLVSERAATFWNSLIVLVCSPTIENNSRIAESYDESDQRKFYVPCPKCEEPQVMEWEQVKWDEGKPELAKYHCVECEHPWTEPQRLKAIQQGEWEATAEFKGHAGFHCSKLASPWEPVPKLAAKFEESRNKREQLKTFVNTQLARTYKEATDVPDWRRLYERREHYDRNVIPREAAFVTMGVDVQGNRLELEIVAWGPLKNSWSIDYRVIMGEPTDSITWEKFAKVVYEEFPIAGSKLKRGIDMVAVDSGYSTQDVYYFCKQFPKTKVMVVKGRDNMTTVVSPPTPVDVKRKGKRFARGQMVWPVGSSHCKGELYGWLKRDGALDGEDDPYGFCHFPQYGENYFKMLTAEELTSKIVNGYTVRQWVKVGERNESLDIRVYARAAASVLGMDRLSYEQLKSKALKKVAVVEKNESEEIPEASDSEKSPSKEAQPHPKKKKKKRKINRKQSSWLGK